MEKTMLTRWPVALLLLLTLQLSSLCAFAGQVALTIDDLPYVGSTNNNPGKLRRENTRFKKILEVLKAEKVPTTGFVVAGTIEPGQWELLEQFHAAGNIIANHTYNHISFRRTSADKFIDSIQRADSKLSPLLSTPKYFRYPYLARNRSCEANLQVDNYLAKNDYVVVPVTIDTKDFYLNQRFLSIPWRERKKYVNSFRRKYINVIRYRMKQAERKAMKKMDRPVKQILLIHMNTLNAYFIADVIKLFRQQGYQFISLPEALQDPYYKTNGRRCG